MQIDPCEWVHHSYLMIGNAAQVVFSMVWKTLLVRWYSKNLVRFMTQKLLFHLFTAQINSSPKDCIFFLLRCYVVYPNGCFVTFSNNLTHAYQLPALQPGNRGWKTLLVRWYSKNLVRFMTQKLLFHLFTAQINSSPKDCIFFLLRCYVVYPNGCFVTFSNNLTHAYQLPALQPGNRVASR